MGLFKEEITLENILDRGDANRGYIKESEIRKLKVEAMPDTGAWTLVINEDIRQKLGLTIEETSTSTLADGKSGTYDVTGGVKIRWKDRSTILPAVVVPNAKEILLGALPLEAMDLMVEPQPNPKGEGSPLDPVHGKLVGVHGDQQLHVLY
jgi:clan AA aspartic protease